MISHTMIMAAGAETGEWVEKELLLPIGSWGSYAPTNANNALTKSSTYAYSSHAQFGSFIYRMNINDSALPNTSQKISSMAINAYAGSDAAGSVALMAYKVYVRPSVTTDSPYVALPIYGYNANTPVVLELDKPAGGWGTFADFKTANAEMGYRPRGIASGTSTQRTYYVEMAVRYKEWVPFTGKKDYSYWRILVTAGNSGANIYIYEIQFRETKGVDQPSVHGTDGVAIESTHYSTYVIANAFNGIPTSSYWAVAKSTLPQWGGFKYTDGGGANDPLKPRDVEQVLIRGSASSANTSAPTKVDIEASEDGVTWEKIKADVALTGWVTKSGGDFRLIDLV